MIKALKRSAFCSALIAILALTAGTATARSFAFPWMSSNSMQNFCSFNHGYFTSAADGSAYTCVKPNGDNYTCTTRKNCAGTTYGATRTIHVQPAPEPQNLASTFSSPAPDRPRKEN